MRRCSVSISLRLAHETSLLLERRGEFVLASHVLGRALAEEAQRINQRELGNLDLFNDEDAPAQSRHLYGTLIEQRGLMQGSAERMPPPSLVPGPAHMDMLPSCHHRSASLTAPVPLCPPQICGGRPLSGLAFFAAY